MRDKEKLNAVPSPSNSAQSGQWSISESNFAIFLSKSSMEHILVQCIEIHSTLLFRSPSRTLVRTQVLPIEFDVKKQRTRKKNGKFTSMGTFRELDIFHISDTKKKIIQRQLHDFIVLRRERETSIQYPNTRRKAKTQIHQLLQRQIQRHQRLLTWCFHNFLHLNSKARAADRNSYNLKY